MFSFIPPLIGLINACPYANKNIFSNRTLNDVGHAEIVFSMLRIATTAMLAFHYCVSMGLVA
jgi:hypothetical protein